MCRLFFFCLLLISRQVTSRVKPIFSPLALSLILPQCIPFCPQRCSPVDGCLGGPRPPAPRSLSPRRSGLERWPFGDAGGIGMQLQSFHLLSLGLERTVWVWKGDFFVVAGAGGYRERPSIFSSPPCGGKGSSSPASWVQPPAFPHGTPLSPIHLHEIKPG